MNPHYVQNQQLTSFLKSRGVTPSVAASIASNLQTAPSVSVRTVLQCRQYTLSFEPTCIDESGTPRLLNVKVVGQEVSGSSSRFVGIIHNLDQFMSTLEHVLGLPPQKSLHQSLLSGNNVLLAGHASGYVKHVVSEDQLMQMGLVEEQL